MPQAAVSTNATISWLASLSREETYLSALQSALLHEAATLFRRRYYLNGSHTGYILIRLPKPARSIGMSVAGKWRIIEMLGFPIDYPDIVETAYILFERQGGGEFAFGACTIYPEASSSAEATGIDFSWDGSDEMDKACGDGDAELRPDGSLQGQIRYRHGDEFPFIARKWTCSTAR